MEYFSRLMSRAVDLQEYIFHSRICKCVDVSHLIFADDLLVVGYGDVATARCIDRILKEFSEVSGLNANPQKSNLITSGVSTRARCRIAQILPYSTGTIPFKYLGIPICSKRIGVQDFTPLLNDINNMIHTWSYKLLSFTGRLEIIL